ncbi:MULTISPECIES: hypothetical protein [unclassified Sphingomonas]|uniref:hypothetical protein n=1 Tax=unclassified Sphingomonas TaxID=196159 RepID=UPI001F564950|nr:MULTISPECIES: hypothetical protein [unclassified Sphingomonas]
MLSTIDPEPDQPSCVLKVGQDTAGHWLVQDSGGRLEGRFISQAAAMAFARSEGHSLRGATIVRVETPLVPTISFARVEPWENAQHLRHAA